MKPENNSFIGKNEGKMSDISIDKTIKNFKLIDDEKGEKVI